MKQEVPDGVMAQLRDAAPRITNVQKLRAFAEKFPSPLAGEIILAALDFLSEPKVTDGKRNGKKIYQHSSLGYGRRLKGNESLLPPRNWPDGIFPGRDILIAISLYAEKEWPKRRQLSYIQKVQHQKYFGVEEPQELVYIFVNILSAELRKRM